MEIVIAPAAVLERPTVTCDPTDAESLAVAGELMEVLARRPDALAVAAPQIGSSLRMMAYRSPDGPTVLSNLQVARAYGRARPDWEGCLSFPGEAFFVPRPTSVLVAGADVVGDLVSIPARGLQARMFQHEIDHLDGVLVTSRAIRRKR